MLDGCFDEAAEERVRTVRTALEFRMSLGGFEVRMILELDRFDEASVRAGAADDEACFFKLRTKGIGDFVSMAMTFVDDLLTAVEFSGFAAFLELARIDAKAHGAAFFGDVFLVWHEVDDRVLGVRDEFGGVCAGHAAYISGKFNDGALHTEAEAEERDLIDARILDGVDLALDAAVAEAAGNDDAVDTLEDFAKIRFLFFEDFGIDPVDLDLVAEGVAGMGQRFDDGEVGVMEFDIFPDESDVDLFSEETMRSTMAFQSSMSHLVSSMPSFWRTMWSRPSSCRRSGTS